LDKSFESKPIKRGVKSHFNSPRNYLNSKSNPSNKMSSQITNNNTCITKSIHFQEIEQHGSSTNYEKRKRRLVETVPQNTEGIGNDDRCTKIDKGHQEIGRRS